MSAEVWVVDNASSDDGVKMIRKEFPQVRIIENNRNIGFGAANNQAMKQAAGEFFLLLNSDTFLKPGAATAMVKYMNEHPKAGVIGPRLVYADGRLQKSCWRFPSPLGAWLDAFGLGNYRRWQHDRERLVDFVIGACMMVRRSVYEEVGGFDEKFFMYSEETDWQRRIRDKGWQIAFVPSAEAVHLAGGSMSDELAERDEIFFRSLDRYISKHYGLLGLVFFRLAMSLGCFLRIIASPFLMVARKRGIKYLKLQLYLFVRQLTHWKIGARNDRFPLVRK